MVDITVLAKMKSGSREVKLMYLVSYSLLSHAPIFSVLFQCSKSVLRLPKAQKSLWAIRPLWCDCRCRSTVYPTWRWKWSKNMGYTSVRYGGFRGKADWIQNNINTARDRFCFIWVLRICAHHHQIVRNVHRHHRKNAVIVVWECLTF